MQQQKITDILTFLHRSKSLESVERYKTSMKEKRNTVAEHSWRLALMALVIGTETKVRVDLGHAVNIALLHDLAEAKTGDIDAYDQIVEGKELIADKAVQEEEAMREMVDDLPLGDWVYALWQEYEKQETLEAKFIKALDKIEGFLHIAEVGVEPYVPEEFHADYATKAVAAFDEATHHFPELKDFLDAVKSDLRTKFEKMGVAWVEGEIDTSGGTAP